jgi:hypothetical protein
MTRQENSKESKGKDREEDGATYQGSPPSYVEGQQVKIDRLENLILRMESLIMTGTKEENNSTRDVPAHAPKAGRAAHAQSVRKKREPE